MPNTRLSPVEERRVEGTPGVAAPLHICRLGVLDRPFAIEQSGLMDSDGHDNARLSELIDAGEFTALLDVVSLDEIAAAWCEFERREPIVRPDEDALSWASQFYSSERLREQHDLHRSAILKLVERVAEDQLCSVGAGPLEFFFSDDAADMRWMAEQARASRRFQRAMGCLTYMNDENVRVLVNEGKWTFIGQ